MFALQTPDCNAVDCGALLVTFVDEFMYHFPSNLHPLYSAIFFSPGQQIHFRVFSNKPSRTKLFLCLYTKQKTKQINCFQGIEHIDCFQVVSWIKHDVVSPVWRSRTLSISTNLTAPITFSLTLFGHDSCHGNLCRISRR